MAEHGFKYREWDVYDDARAFRMAVQEILQILPQNERFALADQLNRASNSIILNIAESANQNTDKSTAWHINKSRCSLDEVVSCIDCAVDSEYITKRDQSSILKSANVLARKLNGFQMYLTRKSQETPIND